jgi:hypothetical protein
MDKKTIQAIHDSIQLKWDPIAAGCGVDAGCQNCPLCQEFYLASGSFSCSGCPVNVVGENCFFRGSKYHLAIMGLKAGRLRDPETAIAVEFLIGLLLETEKKIYDL